MKLLFDQNLSVKLCSRLVDLFTDSSHVRSLGLETASDGEIWQYAKDHGFVLVSQDSDFVELVTHHGAPPQLVWLRCGNQPTSEIERLLREHSSEI